MHKQLFVNLFFQSVIFMILGPNFKPLCIEYPSVDQIPSNLIQTPQSIAFKTSHRKCPFKEQFQNEDTPHIIKSIYYQYGTIEGRRAARYFYRNNPVRLVFSDAKDSFLGKLSNVNGNRPSVRFPPLTATSNVARNLREIGLKWVIARLFQTLNYISFDEPQLEEMTPDLLLVSQEDAKDLEYCTEKRISIQDSKSYSFEHALFIEIKAYHQSALCSEKELLQAYTYALKGEKALLITSGTLDEMNLLENMDSFEVFSEQAIKKYRKLAKETNLGLGQDSWDTRGIYLSAVSKIKKYAKFWDDYKKQPFIRIKKPLEILRFLTSPNKIGIVEPAALKELLIQRQLVKEANLFENLERLFLEEIMINPPLLYPQ